MERPFDYPGSNSDILTASFDQMRQITLSQLVREDDETNVSWSIWSVPNWWTDQDMQDIIDIHFPHERCHHDYDCCGYSYGRKAQWSWHPYSPEYGLKTVVISRQYNLNI